MVKAINQFRQQPWTAASLFNSLSIPLSIASALFGLLVLLAYQLQLEFVYRPIVNGPATHPLTALCLFLLGYAFFASAIKKTSWFQNILATSVLIMTGVRLLDEWFVLSLHHWVTPYMDQVLAELNVGLMNSMGANTAMMLFLIALSFLLRSWNRAFVSQIVGLLALMIPTVAFFGFAYQIEDFFGEMSLITATIDYGLTFSALAFTAQVGFLRAFLSPHIGGQLSRYQVLIGMSIPALLGYLFVKTIQNADAQSAFGLFVVTLCWFIFLLVGLSAIYHEKVDSERCQMMQQLQAAAHQDALTGLPNRRKFFEYGERELVRARRDQKQLWVMMIDIDHFKLVNDRAGHEMGDRALIEVSRAISNSVREIDLVARLGGEEFAVLLSDANESTRAVYRVAESIRRNVERVVIENWTETQGPLTVSIGVASSTTALELENILKLADDSLYEAKNNGRNQVCINRHDNPALSPVV